MSTNQAECSVCREGGALSRRHLLTGTAGALFAAAAPGLNVSFAQTATARDILVVLFLRGGSDSLHMISPAGDPEYIRNRPTVRILPTGTTTGTPGIGLDSLDGTDFYLHQNAPELKALYDADKLAVVHAVGLNTRDRSHFTCQDMYEKGVGELALNENKGWLTRHIEATSAGPRPLLSTISAVSNNPISLLGYAGAVAVPNAATFNVSGGDANANVIRALAQGDSDYARVATGTVDSIRSVQQGLLRPETATSAEATYPGGGLTTALRSLARMIKMNVGIDVATVDMGGWDNHDNMAGEFGARVTELSRNLNAFWTDLAAYQDRLTLVTMTEFGRRVRQNASAGTDHGSASYMYVLGGNVNGGRIYGTWPGLADNQLTNGDLAVTTDYRRVVSEILVKRHGSTDISTTFPGVPYDPIGILRG